MPGSDPADDVERGAQRKCFCACGKSKRDHPTDDNGAPTLCYKFRQQELWAITPILSPKVVIAMYTLMGCILLPLGIVMILENGSIVRTNDLRYDNLAQCDVGDFFESTKVCTVPFRVTKTIPSPSYLYYGLTNFYQNARTYAQSRSANQLMGQWPLSAAQLDTCEPILDDPDTGAPIPCGLTAWSYFNDSFTLCKDTACAQTLNTTTSGIAWKSDVTEKFLPGPTAPDGPWTEEANELITSEPFMVWMRLAAFKDFIKLAAIIREPIQPGEYYVRIVNNYPVGSFDGTKFLVISTVTWFGGKNNFLAISYTVTGSICFALALVFVIREMTRPRPAAYDEPELVRQRLEEIANESERADGLME
mmetsp:Transcript_11182/g.30071  ORF Transcript_11182/g.30071 Transcript_11182/m.30071 type:complete len:363 (+) Transcript_11182:231-1319(+)|eukprot:CAMPEP_0185837034 /NCGR_PEP_ID=MMETSP1353-20130828/10680_1 /TAXON_ID=1077150 /ORGANISM="Erythrolobus australicus, Strain CCMP3124" /LENGTH=362 /DNA_ID=CAMNT_0028535887 /DNA_START=229 /DNA_END=1317 /DNA_ORIENTATION=+